MGEGTGGGTGGVTVGGMGEGLTGGADGTAGAGSSRAIGAGGVAILARRLESVCATAGSVVSTDGAEVEAMMTSLSTLGVLVDAATRRRGSTVGLALGRATVGLAASFGDGGLSRATGTAGPGSLPCVGLSLPVVSRRKGALS